MGPPRCAFMTPDRAEIILFVEPRPCKILIKQKAIYYPNGLALKPFCSCYVVPGEMCLQNGGICILSPVIYIAHSDCPVPRQALMLKRCMDLYSLFE